MPETRLYAKLAATSGITDLVGTRIYPAQRYQGTALPAVTFLRVGTDRPGCSTGSVNVAWARIQVDSIASTYNAAKALAAAVADALCGWSEAEGTPPIDQCNPGGEFDAPEPEYAGQDVRDFRIIQEYIVQYGIS